jgi:hypothetical protein
VLWVVSVGEDRPSALARLIEDNTVEKVFHHAPFDLRFMVSAWQVSPAAIRDTKVASKILDPAAPNETWPSAACRPLSQLAQRSGSRERLVSVGADR